MTTTPVMSITDEQIAEIEAAAEINAYVTNPWRFEGLATASAVSALISRLRAAEKDAGRYREIRKTCYVSGYGWSIKYNCKNLGQYDFNLKGEARMTSFDAAIDAAMEQSK